MAELERVQILLEAKQRRALVRIAKREGRSVSDILREMVELGLEQRTQKSEKWKQALRRLRQVRAANQPRGLYTGNLVAEARAERDRQNEAVWRKSS
jgi:hypothetical protein